MYFNLQDLTKKWSDVRQLVPQRDQTLQNELRKQQSILPLDKEIFLLSIVMSKVLLQNVHNWSLFKKLFYKY